MRSASAFSCCNWQVRVIVSSRAMAILAVETPRAEHDLPPLHGRAKRAFGSVVRRFDALLVHEGKEVWKMEEERSREIPHIGVSVR